MGKRKQKIRYLEQDILTLQSNHRRMSEEMRNLKYNTLQYVLLVLGQVQEDRDKRGEGG